MVLNFQAKFQIIALLRFSIKDSITKISIKEENKMAFLHLSFII